MAHSGILDPCHHNLRMGLHRRVWCDSPPPLPLLYHHIVHNDAKLYQPAWHQRLTLSILIIVLLKALEPSQMSAVLSYLLVIIFDIGGAMFGLGNLAGIVKVNK